MAENTVVPVFGFKIRKFTALPGKGEEDMGKIQFILEAPKDELRSTEHDVNDILGAMNMHHSTQEPISVHLRF